MSSDPADSADSPNPSDLPAPAESSDRPSNPFADYGIVEAEIAEQAQPSLNDEAATITQKLGRLHPLSLVFEVISHVRSLIFPAVIAIFSAANGRIDGLIFAGIIFVPTLIRSTIRYFSLRYQIRESELVVTEGIFFQRIRTVPIERIQNIDLIQNLLHRVFNLAEVRIETASGTEAEATLRVLSMSKVEQLREAIFKPQSTRPSSEDATDALSAESTLADAAQIVVREESETLHSIGISELIRAGIASNRGTILLGVLFGAYFQFDDQLEQIVDIKSMIRAVSEGMDTYTIVFVSIAVFIGLLLLFRLLGIAWYILRFQGYELTRCGEDLRIRCGLFTKVSATVPRKRIQFISIQQNWLMRWMKLSSIRIETAGAAGKGKEDATKTVSSRWFLPVVADHRVRELVEALRPGLVWDWESFDWQPISPKAGRRMIRIAIFVSILLGIGGYLSLGLWGITAGLAAMPCLIWLAIKRSKSKKFTRTDQIIAYRSGIFTRRTSMTFFEKVQTVSVYESPFDRRWGMATLCVDTAAAGPADHKIKIGYLTNELAKSEFEAIVQQSSGKQPVFG